jgi:hypothetical protein
MGEINEKRKSKRERERKDSAGAGSYLEPKKKHFNLRQTPL